MSENSLFMTTSRQVTWWDILGRDATNHGAKTPNLQRNKDMFVRHMLHLWRKPHRILLRILLHLTMSKFDILLL